MSDPAEIEALRARARILAEQAEALRHDLARSREEVTRLSHLLAEAQEARAPGWWLRLTGRGRGG